MWFKKKNTEKNEIPNDGSFMETYAIVRCKKANGVPMTTAKEELMEDFLEDWADAFGLSEK